MKKNRETGIKTTRIHAFRLPLLTAAFLFMLVFSFVLSFCLKTAETNSARAAEAETSAYNSFENLQAAISDTAAPEVKLVSGTIVFPTAITVNRDMEIKAVDAPAVFVMEHDSDYPPNDGVFQGINGKKDITLRDYERHFVIYPKDENGNRITVTFINIIFRTENGVGGINVPAGNVRLILDNCTFEGLGNEEFRYGGAVNCWYYTSNFYAHDPHPFSITARDCIFIRNRALIASVIYTHANSPEARNNTAVKLERCVLLHNSSYLSSVYTEIYAESAMTVTLTDCIESNDDGAADACIGIRNGKAFVSKTGYDLSGWVDWNGLPVPLGDGSVAMIKGAVPAWTPDVFAIHYNGLAFSADYGLPSAHTYGTPTVIPQVQREGYAFVGWLAAGADVPAKNLTLSATDVLSDVTLTAVWEALPRKPFPGWAIVIIIVGGFSLFVTGVAVMAHRRRHILAMQPEGGSLGQENSQGETAEAGLGRMAEKYGLTQREKEVAALLIAGKSQIAIAGELFIASGTAHRHILNIYEKTGVKSKFELIAKSKEE